MKLKSKKLIIAVCMLLVSVTMLSSASFAWFSMNTQVSVDGIEVEAYSDALFLEISDDGRDYDTSVTLADAKKTLRVVTQKKLDRGYRITEITLTGVQYTDGRFYVPTADSTYVDGTVYYETGFEAVTTLQNGDDVSELFVASGTGYVLTGDEVYNDEENVTYYKQAYSEVDTTNFDETTSVTAYYEAFDQLYAKGKAVNASTVDTYVANNYIEASYTDSSEVAGLYKNPTITRIETALKYELYVAATGTYDSTVEYYAYSSGAYAPLDTSSNFEEGSTDMSTYYVVNPAEYYAVGTMEDQNTYTKVTNIANGASLKGYYTISGATQYADALYDGVSNYYEKVGDKFILVTDLAVADSFDGLVALDVEELDLTEIEGVDETDDAENIVVYAADTHGYSYVGEYTEGDNILNEIYWARAYSAASDEYAAATPLNVIKDSKLGNYYLMKTIYLRCAENTNDATNLKIEDIIVKGPATDINKSLSILFVATSTSGETKVVEFKNSDPNAINGTVLFDKLLGNARETITLEMCFYFDGEYTEVTTDNAADIAGQSIEIKFAIDNHSYN